MRNDALGRTGVTPEQVVREACRVARGYSGAQGGRRRRLLQNLPSPCYAALGAGAIGLVWLLATLL